MLEWSDPNSRNLLFQSPRCFSSHSSISWHDTMRGKIYPRGNSTRLSSCFPYIPGEIVPLSLVSLLKIYPRGDPPLSSCCPSEDISLGKLYPYPLVSLLALYPRGISIPIPLFPSEDISLGKLYPYPLFSILTLYPRGDSTPISLFPFWGYIQEEIPPLSPGFRSFWLYPRDPRGNTSLYSVK